MTARATWPTGLCGCCSVQDVGVNCCAAHCFCGVQIWQQALEVAGLPRAEIRAAAAQQQQAERLGALADNPYAAAMRVAPSVSADFAGVDLRGDLHKKLYGAPLPSSTRAWVARACLPCARCQEVNAVQVAALERGRVMRYGSCVQWRCGEFVDERGMMVRSLDAADRPLLPGGEAMKR